MITIRFFRIFEFSSSHSNQVCPRHFVSLEFGNYFLNLVGGMFSSEFFVEVALFSCNFTQLSISSLNALINGGFLWRIPILDIDLPIFKYLLLALSATDPPPVYRLKSYHPNQYLCLLSSF